MSCSYTKDPNGIIEPEGSVYTDSIYFGHEVAPFIGTLGPCMYYSGTWTVRLYRGIRIVYLRKSLSKTPERTDWTIC